MNTQSYRRRLLRVSQSRPVVKICGNVYFDDSLMVAAARPDLMGWIFSPHSKRRVSIESAARQIECIQREHPDIFHVAVCAGNSIPDILRIARAIPGFDFVQIVDGSFRDGLGELQKVLNFIENKKVTKEDVEKITGAPKTTLINDFLISMSTQNIEKGMSTIKAVSAKNLDIELYLKLIIQKFRMAIILRYAPKLKAEMVGDLSESDLEFLQEIVKTDTTGVFTSGTLATLLEAYQNIDNAFVPELPLELALIKIASSKTS
jgi:phosphoribosylanthranilate isomerase